jgi:hypothetical protein
LRKKAKDLMKRKEFNRRSCEGCIEFERTWAVERKCSSSSEVTSMYICTYVRTYIPTYIHTSDKLREVSKA